MSTRKRAGARRPTIADIAQRAGVSPTAVSFTLNDRPGVGPETRERILAAARELRWRPHRAAQVLSGMRTDSVGLVVARPARTLSVEPFFSQLLSGLQAGLARDLVALQLLVVEDMGTEIGVYERWAAERRVDGLVLVDLEVDDPRPALLAELDVPALALGGDGTPTPVPTVWVDDYHAMFDVVEHLAGLGHRRIVHVGGIPTYQHSVRRVRALHDAAVRYGLDIRSLPTDYSQSASATVTREVLSGGDAPSAIVYDSDVAALAGLATAAELGVRIPSDLSVVSFDDSELAQLVHPPLTALTRDTHALGMSVARLLLGLVEGVEVPAVTEAPRPRLTVRASTTPPVG